MSTRWWMVLMVALPVTVLGQSARIEGSVRDEAGRPLPGATVEVEGLARGDAADAAGRYAIGDLVPGTYVLRASLLGYRAQTVTVTLDVGLRQVDFVLVAVPLTAGEVVVTASRTAQQAERVAQSVALVTPREIAARGDETLDGVLRHVPGVQLADNQVSIRGSSGFSYNVGSRVLLLVDGLPMLGPDAEGVPFEVVPLAQVAQIEVVKGPGSALYGGGALGGVVNVRTRDFPERPRSSFAAEYGAHLPVRHLAWRTRWSRADTPRPFSVLSASHARRLSDQLGFWASASYRYMAGHVRLGASERLLAYAKLGYRPAPRLGLSVLGGMTRSKSDAFLYWNGLDDPLNPGTIALGGAATTGSEDNLTYRFSLLPQLTHTLSPTLFYRVSGRVFGVWLRPLDERGQPRASIRGTIGLRYGGEAQLTWMPAHGTLTAGVLVDANAVRSSYFGDTPPFLSQPEGAVFAQWQHTVTARLDATLGARFDAYALESDRIEKQLSPKLSLSYRLAEAWYLRASAGAGFRVPGVTERYVDDSSLFPIVSNPTLLPETSRGYELGARGRVAGVRLDGAVFWTDFRRLVEPTFVSGGGAQGFQFVNLTRARIRGLEVQTEKGFADERFRVRVAYQWLDARDLGEDRALTFRSRHLVQGTLDARLGVFTLGADARYSSRPSRVDSDFARFVPDADVLVDTRVLDLRAGWVWRALTATVFVRNALDHYYAERPAVLAPPRSVSVRLTAQL